MGPLLTHSFPSSCPQALPFNLALVEKTKRWLWVPTCPTTWRWWGSHKEVVFIAICADRGRWLAMGGCGGRRGLEARPINSLVADKSLLNIPPPLPVQCPSPGRLACLRKISLEGEVGDTFFSKSVCIHYTELVHKPITWTKTEECNGESISFWVPCRGKAQFSPSQLDNLGKLCCLPLTIVFLSVKAGMPLISM